MTTPVKPISDVLCAVLDGIQNRADSEIPFGRPSTGLCALDKVLHFKNGLYILAGRPAMGKTALSLAVAHSSAQSDLRVLLVTDTAIDAVERLICIVGGISVNRLALAQLHDFEWSQLSAAIEILRSLPIFIVDTESFFSQHAEVGENLGCEEAPHLLVVDSPRTVQQNLECLMRISRSLPVIATATLSSEMEFYRDKRPNLRCIDAELELAADAILLISRLRYYDQEGSVDPIAPVNVFIAKQSAGLVANVDLFFDHRPACFVNEADDDHSRGRCH